MFFAEDDLTLHITRGDTGELVVRAIDETTDGGETPYIFKAGDVLRLKVYEKKNCENVVLQKDFGVEEETEIATLTLTETDTRIGNTINKPVDYWYEIELNPFTEPQTIVGYDDDGAKVFKLYPEARDNEIVPPTAEEVGAVDSELSLTSQNAIQNQAVSRAIASLTSTVKANEKTATESFASANAKIDSTFAVANERIDSTNNEIAKTNTNVAVLTSRVNNLSSLSEGSTTGDAELQDIRVGYKGKTYTTAGEAVRGQITDIDNIINRKESLLIGSISATSIASMWEDFTYNFTAKKDLTLNSIELPIYIKPIDWYSVGGLSGEVIPDNGRFQVSIIIAKKNADVESYTTVYSGDMFYYDKLVINKANLCVLSSLLDGGIKLEKNAEYKITILADYGQTLTQGFQEYDLKLLLYNSTGDKQLYNDDFISCIEMSEYTQYEPYGGFISNKNRLAATFNISSGRIAHISDKLNNVESQITTIVNDLTNKGIVIDDVKEQLNLLSAKVDDELISAETLIDESGVLDE